jgi:hypothetical protein
MKILLQNTIKTIILFIVFAFFSNVVLSQNQKAWNGNIGGFRIDTTINSSSQVTWSLTLGSGSTTSKVDGGGRKGLTTVTWGNTTSAMIRDTIKAFETLNFCTSSLVNKPVDVYPKPVVSIGGNDTLCIGGTLSSKTLTVSNYSTIGGASNLGEFNITVDLRIGSTSGLSAIGGPFTLPSATSSGVITVPAIPTGSLPTGTYFLVITNFASNVAAASNNPAPGSYASGSSVATVTAIPTNYLVYIRPAFTTPTIQAY